MSRLQDLRRKFRVIRQRKLDEQKKHYSPYRAGEIAAYQAMLNEMFRS